MMYWLPNGLFLSLLFGQFDILFMLNYKLLNFLFYIKSILLLLCYIVLILDFCIYGS